ncbi:NCS2 family permease [uncultured Limosilactobacillus sp.]|uniref:NCS2 family permease n=1 Tax=uncultured Limosilactobacillus sp. TaxID=2837629 RepID=UPI0025D77B0B|nr:NCS2 family permease [uncultured Limosilactobacillus sp.]
MQTIAEWLDRRFQLSTHHTSVRKETVAGLTTFVSMAYILFVNPSVLGTAGMNKGAVFTATALAAIIGCLLMAFLANYPMAIAPGLADNAFFTYSVVLSLGIPWQKAMTGVFVASVLFTILSFMKVREIVINAIPHDLKLAMASGIGLFIAFVGLKEGGLVVGSKASLVTLGSLTVPTTWLTICGLLIIGILMARQVPGAIFYGMLSTMIIGLLTGLIKLPSRLISVAPSLKPTFAVGIRYLPTMRDPQMWAVVLVFLLVAFFDTAGTLVGLAQQAGLMKHDQLPRIGQALMADSLSMLAGSVLGTTPTSCYVESSAGIAVGGRTGLTAFVVAILFAFSMLFSPLLTVVTDQVTAPALIIVGVLMVSAMKGIHWERFEVALPCFLTIIGMPLTYNISYGLAFGFLTSPLMLIAAGKKKEVNGVMWGLFIVFIIMLYILNVLPK